MSATALLTVVSSDRWVQQCNKLFIQPGQLVAYSSHPDELVSMGNIFKVLSYALKFSVSCLYLALRYTYKQTSHRTQQLNVLFHFILNFIPSVDFSIWKSFNYEPSAQSGYSLVSIFKKAAFYFWWFWCLKRVLTSHTTTTTGLLYRFTVKSVKETMSPLSGAIDTSKISINVPCGVNVNVKNEHLRTSFFPQAILTINSHKPTQHTSYIIHIHPATLHRVIFFFFCECFCLCLLFIANSCL